MYAPAFIVNTILNSSFDNKNLMNSMRLNRILYFVSNEYIKISANNNPLISESFSAWDYGPVLLSVHDYYASFQGKNITKYMKNVYGDNEMLNVHTDKAFAIALSRVWNNTSLLDKVYLSDIARKPESAWDKAFQTNKTLIDNAHMITDYTYYNDLGLQ